MNLQHTQQQSRLPILFYSNFSRSSKKFLNLVKKYNLEPRFNPVCIDHKNFRDKLRKSNILKINKVPCVIKLFQGGTVEKYDDKAVFDWLDILINKVEPPPENPVYEITDESVNAELNITDERTDEISHNKVEERQTKNTNSFGEGKTSIIDIMTDDDEYDDGVKQGINKPVTAIRSDSGNYEFENFGEHEVQDNPNNLRGIKQNTDTASKSDIISLAQSMQKSRELEDSNSINPSHVNLEKSIRQT